MNSITTIAGTAGRITGTTVRVARELNALIDWRDVAAIVWEMTVILAVLTWHAGRATGRGVHRLNDWLAGTCKDRLQVAATDRQVLADPAPQPIPAVHPLAALAAELEQLTVRELQALTGTRRRVAKARLVAMAAAAV